MVTFTLLLAASGCGSSSHAVTKKANVAATGATGSHIEFKSPKHGGIRRASIEVTSTAITTSGTLVSRYDCRGADVSPELHWRLPLSAVAKTKEIVVVVRTINKSGVVTDWALAGISPRVEQIQAGRPPAGAILGRDTSGQEGYNLCPKLPGFITMGVYAFPYKPNLKPGFSPTELRNYLADPSVPWGSAELYFT